MLHNKLLIDQNLPSNLVIKLQDIFPNSIHVKQLFFSTSPDILLWKYAKENQYHIITKDTDFENLSLRYEFPPKVILVRKKNCPTYEMEKFIRGKFLIIQNFLVNSDYGCLILRE